MSKNGTYFIIFIILLLPNTGISKNYIGLGPEYLYPVGRLKEVNMESLGLTAHLESRLYCRLWYGLRFDYISFNKVDTVLTDYYTSAVLLSPVLKLNLIGCDDYTQKILPYIQGMLTFSSIGGEDKADRLGFGVAAGLGAAYGFQLFDLCWMLDLNAIYSAPNAILRANERPSLHSINVSFCLEVGL